MKALILKYLTTLHNENEQSLVLANCFKELEVPYIKRGNTTLIDELQKLTAHKVFIFFWNCQRDEISLKNENLFLQIIKEQACLFYDYFVQPLPNDIKERIRIVRYKKGLIVSMDFLMNEYLNSTVCCAKTLKEKIFVQKKPKTLINLQITYLKSIFNCGKCLDKDFDWECNECHSFIEFDKSTGNYNCL